MIMHSLALMIFSAVFYGTCSASMNFFNKFLLTSWSFDFPSAVLLAQLIFVTATLKLLKSMGWVKVVPYNFANAKSCALLSIFYFSNTLLALFALEGMNVPMYNSLRRCVPMASLILGFVWYKKRQSQLVVFSIIVVTIGTVIAATGDLQFDAKSYLLGIVSVLLMALYLLRLQHNGTDDHFSANDLLYLNTVNCLPVASLLCLSKTDDLLTYEHYHDWRFLVSFVFVASSGCVLNYSMFLCTTVNSALTTTCVGVIKSAFTSVLGMFVLGGVTPTAGFVTGLIINFSGGTLYVYAKYLDKTTTRNYNDSNFRFQRVKSPKSRDEQSRVIHARPSAHEAGFRNEIRAAGRGIYSLLNAQSAKVLGVQHLACKWV